MLKWRYASVTRTLEAETGHEVSSGHEDGHEAGHEAETGAPPGLMFTAEPASPFPPGVASLRALR